MWICVDMCPCVWAPERSRKGLVPSACNLMSVPRISTQVLQKSRKHTSALWLLFSTTLSFYWDSVLPNIAYALSNHEPFSLSFSNNNQESKLEGWLLSVTFEIGIGMFFKLHCDHLFLTDINKSSTTKIIYLEKILPQH